METIIIYGMRGTGKSTIGKQVAEKIGNIFIDLDTFIEKKVGMKLNKYIEINKWDKFRNIEHESLKEILKIKGKKVISLGGGTIIFERNIKEINIIKNKKLIFLETDINIIEKRILKDEKNNEKRNSLTGGNIINELKVVYKEREKKYKTNADFIINNNGKIEEAINSIIDLINKPKICIPIVNFEETKINEIFKEIEKINQIQYIELRIDYLKDLSKLKNIINSSNKKVIITNRLEKEGGNFKGTFEESLEILKKALSYGADFIDIELQLLESTKNVNMDFKKVIISSHNFKKTPRIDNLKNVLYKIKQYNPSIYKIAVTPNSEKDVEEIYELTNYFNEHFLGKDFIFISMGKLGMQTRIDIPKMGGLLSFATIGTQESAPGQINYKDLL